jgi:outer membrane protein OmpA-like peptidoglycan-associated protein
MGKCENRRRLGGCALAAWFAGMTLLAALGGCNPIEAYRRWTGVAANDPDPATTPNTKNLAAGDARSYPNLATVPPPPSAALTAAELDKLTKGLIADRTNTKSASEHLQTPSNEAAPPPPPPPAAPTLSLPGGAAPAMPRSNPAPGPVSPAAPGAGPATVAAAPAGRPASAPAGAGAGAKATPFAGLGAPGKSKPPPEPGPIESTLQSPQIASLPQAEQSRPAPSPPAMLALPRAPGAAAAGGARLPPPPVVPPLPAALGSAKFEPAPPPPNLAPAAPIRTATATAAGKPAKPPPPETFAKVAEIAFSGDVTTLAAADRETLDKVLQRYRAKPSPVRVVGYAGVGSSAAEQLNAYRTALDRAQAVADGLRKAGIPAAKIEVQAAPTATDSGSGRAEILFAQ